MSVSAIGSVAVLEEPPAVAGAVLADPSINVCFSTTDGPLSGFIRWVLRAPVSHSMITFYSHTLDRVMVMEATSRGFNLVPWKHWKKSNTLVARFSIRLPLEQQVKALHQIAKLLGTEFDNVSLFGFALRRWIRKQTRNPLDDPNKLFCSEAVARFLLQLGEKECDDPPRWTPADVFKHLIAAADRFERVEEGKDIDVAIARARRGKPWEK